MTEEFIDLSCCRIKLTLKDSRIILLINMMNKERLEAIQVDQKIKVSTQARDQQYQEDPNNQKKAVFRKFDLFIIKVLNK